jgi:hypothetical protein
MPTIRGVPVSDHTFELNKHLALPTELTKAATPKRAAVRMWRTEREFQAAVIQSAKWEALHTPQYNLLFHIPNENSHKTPGVKGGVPDLFLAVPRGKYGGLFIELKTGDGKPSQKQLDIIADLRAAGYVCHIIWDSVDEVISCVAAYLNME